MDNPALKIDENWKDKAECPYAVSDLPDLADRVLAGLSAERNEIIDVYLLEFWLSKNGRPSLPGDHTHLRTSKRRYLNEQCEWIAAYLRGRALASTLLSGFGAAPFLGLL